MPVLALLLLLSLTPLRRRILPAMVAAKRAPAIWGLPSRVEPDQHRRAVLDDDKNWTTRRRYLDMRAISLAEANKIINGTFASAKKHKAHALAAIVLDAGGRVKAFQKQDGASLLRFEIAYGKAFASLGLNRSSRQVLQQQKEKPAFMESLAALSDGPLFLEAGGQLIRDKTGEVVGALGVTG